MSADNGFLMRRHPKGGFCLQMYFASDDTLFDLKAHEDLEQYETMEAALLEFGKPENQDYMGRYWSEYGLSVHPECYEEVPKQQKFSVQILDEERETKTTITVIGDPESGYTVRNHIPELDKGPIMIYTIMK